MLTISLDVDGMRTISRGGGVQFLWFTTDQLRFVLGEFDTGIISDEEAARDTTNLVGGRGEEELSPMFADSNDPLFGQARSMR
jgi:hypothetical protein